MTTRSHQVSRRALLQMMAGSSAAVALAACSANGSSSSSTSTSSSGSSGASGLITGTSVITEVFGDGQKVTAVAVKYGQDIDGSSLTSATYSIDNYTVTKVYTNNQPSTSASPTTGPYVIVEVSTSKINAEYTLENSSGGSTPGSSSSSDSSSRPTGQPTGMASGGAPSGSSIGSGTVSNQLSVTLKQTAAIKAAGGSSLAASAAVTTNYKDNVNLVVDQFKQSKYTDSSTSDSLMYNLFSPQITTGKTYPLVVFMPDATATSTDPVATLTQGLGAIVWAEQDSQAANPTFVLAPQYTGSEKDDKADTVALIKQIVASNPIDASRVYLTGQSAGTIRAIAMLIDQPDTYAGAMLVAGQADSGYTSKLAQLAGQKLWMICSTGDARALPGMTAIQSSVEGVGTQVTKSSWSATLPLATQDVDAAAAASAATSIKFTVLSDVVPDGVTDNDVTEHLNTWRVAYSVDKIREWIFQQKR